MKKITFIFTLAIASALFSCGGSNEKLDPKTSQTDTTTAQVSTKTIEEPIISLTLEEAKQRMRAFLKENKRKYIDYGTVEENYLMSGNYTKDGALDYFYTVHFYPGGDFIYPTHFFYDSEKDAIRELELGKGPDAFQHIVVKKITEGKLFGNAVIWSAFSGEHAASKDVKAEFTIDGNKINVDPKFFPALYNAEKKVLQELEQMEREMMEAADAYNAEEGM
jgi:hypothetical protein